MRMRADCRGSVTGSEPSNGPQSGSMNRNVFFDRKIRFAVLALLLISVVLFGMPHGAGAKTGSDAKTAALEKKQEKIVKVGWYESPFNKTDEFGRKSGYAYEYQRKIAAYTGWKYKYVKGDWIELLDKLKKGEIDLMSDVSYSAERSKEMLYASLPMGTEAYYVYVSPDNKSITADNVSSLTGKKTGVMRDSVQKGLFLDWEKKHGVRAKLKEMDCSEEESLEQLNKGKLDAFITLDTYADPKSAVPVFKIGSSDFFFAVNKSRTDLLEELDTAMSRIQDENKYYNLEMSEKLLRNTGTNLYLSPAEEKWLKKHGTIKVGYQDDYMAFCAKDEKNGKLTGALKDYLEYATAGMENADVEFKPIAYPTASDALKALEKGEVDCMFPANLTDYDGEKMGVVMTPKLMRTEMDAVVREKDKKDFVHKKDVIVAVNEGNTNYEMFLKDNFPTWKIKHYKDTPSGLEGIANGEADCVIISNYRFSNISKQCEDLHLTTVYSGVDMDYCLAVREGDTELYSILSKVTDMVPDSTINAALTYYSTEDVKTSFADIIKDNWAVILLVIALVVMLIMLLLLRSIQAEKKALEERRMVDALNKKVYVDPLTSVKNKGAFENAVQTLDDKIAAGEKPEFAIGVFDCDDLKMINDRNGHDKGDEYLIAASHLICDIFDHSPVFRIGGDEFAVILQNRDYENREELVYQFDLAQRELCDMAEHEWDEVHVALGVAAYDPDVDYSATDTERRADKIMYENKRARKGFDNTE